jgi:hypothetical protein
MHMGSDEFELTPVGFSLDIWACHKQFLGLEKAKREVGIDYVIPT